MSGLQPDGRKWVAPRRHPAGGPYATGGRAHTGRYTDRYTSRQSDTPGAGLFFNMLRSALPGAWLRLIEVARFQFDRLAAVALQHALRGGLDARAIRFE
ncbi:hypothetical protein LMG29542_00720 [Paraburkholderia humisilvae]|uniref:Uncharacterized protein n=1 Tax=Paraburkholderia humisilvae TaxID=627669 RepID=A0A6J5D3U6_9BURK|nr:hypothetical protein LMG29542_00720 [Paraburkholderia humisilvae]